MICTQLHTHDDIARKLRERDGDMQYAQILADLNGVTLLEIKTIAAEHGIEVKKLSRNHFDDIERRAIKRMMSAGFGYTIISERLKRKPQDVVSEMRRMGHVTRIRKTK